MGNFSSSTAATKLPDLQAVSHLDTAKFMGTWFVIGVKPTIFEKTCSNAVERYTRLTPGMSYDIDIDFTYNKGEDPMTSPVGKAPQKGWVQGKDSGTWKVSPFWPVKLPYLVLEVDDAYQWTVIGYPNREYCWIMHRTPVMPEKTYEMLVQKLKDKHQYDLTGLRRVPQIWTAGERHKRGLSVSEIPDSMLQKGRRFP